MAILRSVDGRFYEVPDDKLEAFAVPEDKVKEKLQQAGAEEGGPDGGPPGGGGGGPLVVVQIIGQGRGAGSGPPTTSMGVGGGAVQAYGHCGWRNCGWRNRGRCRA